MYKNIKKGFIAIEAVIIAAVCIIGGLAGTSAFLKNGQSAQARSAEAMNNTIDMIGEEFDFSVGGGLGDLFGSTTVPEGGTYFRYISEGNYETLEAGASMPTLANGDIYAYGDYTYAYSESINGWKVGVEDKTKTTYEPILKKINGKNVVSINTTFYGCNNLEAVPVLHEYIEDLTFAFYGCANLKDATNLKYATNIKSMYCTFYNCTNLELLPTALPKTITDLTYTFYNCAKITVAPEMGSITNTKSMNATFYGCSSLISVPSLPKNVEDMTWTFGYCRNLTTVPAIPSSVTNLTYTFCICPLLQGDIEINTNATVIDGAFYGTECWIYLTGSATTTTKNNLVATAINNNVFIK